MKKLAALIAAGAFALSTGALAQTAAPAKPADKAAAMATKMEKPASVAQAEWDKMTDAQKKDAVEKAKKAGDKMAAPAKKEKKGGC